MKIYDTNIQRPQSHTKKKTTILHQASNFKVRIIELAPGGSIPPCEMASSVIFHVLSGSADVKTDGKTASVTEGQGIISDPATISMASKTGAKLLGIQIDYLETGGADG
jgi:quercetin dioxygenase-like cupin family protein